MIIFPAIDIKGGKCVRLLKGDFNQLKEYEKSPLEQAKIFINFGFYNLHIVDLDGALKGKSFSKEIIKGIENKEIVIDPFDINCLGTNSYDVHLGNYVTHLDIKHSIAISLNRFFNSVTPYQWWMSLRAVIDCVAIQEKMDQILVQQGNCLMPFPVI